MDAVANGNLRQPCQRQASQHLTVQFLRTGLDGPPASSSVRAVTAPISSHHEGSGSLMSRTAASNAAQSKAQSSGRGPSTMGLARRRPGGGQSSATRCATRCGAVSATSHATARPMEWPMRSTRWNRMRSRNAMTSSRMHNSPYGPPRVVAPKPRHLRHI